MWAVVPKEGYDEIALAELGVSSKTAYVIRYKNGVIVDRLPATRENIEKLKPRMPKVELQIGDPDRMKRYVEDFSYKKMLYSGSSPFRQIIIDVVEDYERRKKYISVDELADKVAKDTDERVSRIRKLIIKMNKAGQLVIRDGNVFVGVRHLDIGVRRITKLIEYVAGVHPVKRYIHMMVDDYGRRSYKDIEDRLMSIGWIKRRETLYRYLQEMINEGCLRKIGGIEGKFGYDEWYEAVACGKY